MNIPSVKTIKERLDWLDKVGDPDELAKQARKVLESFIPTGNRRPSDRRLENGMEKLNALLQCHGVEYARHRKDDMHDAYGLTYLNVGDIYVATIIYNHKTDTICVTTLGDIIEKHMNEYP